MAYNKDIYDLAVKELSLRKKKAEDELAVRESRLAAVEPEYTKIVEELAKTGSQTVRIIIEKKADAMKQIAELKDKNLMLQKRIYEILAEHGMPEDYLKPHYVCEKCADTGFVDGIMCSCLTRLMKEISFEQLNADTPLSLSSFEKFSLDYYPMNAGDSMSPRRVMEQVLKNCKWYADNFSRNSPSLLFQGATGLGKTHLSLAIASTAIEKGYGVIYGSVQELMNKIENEHFGREQAKHDTRRLLIDCDLLILDDLGTEFITQFTVSALYHIINSRLLGNKPTIISTNLTLNELEEKYSERIVSRIAGNYRMLKFVGNDIRMLIK